MGAEVEAEAEVEAVGGAYTGGGNMAKPPDDDGVLGIDKVVAEEVDERNVVSTSGHETGTACTEHTYTSTFFVEHAIMSLIATRNSPPVSVAL